MKISIMLVATAVYQSYYCTIHNLGGRNFGETVRTRNWRIIFWRMSKIAKAPKIIIMCQPFTDQLES